MKATYGFRATMTARPGKGDELVDLLLSATTDGSGASEHCVVYLVGRSASNREVVHVTEGWTTRVSSRNRPSRDQLEGVAGSPDLNNGRSSREPSAGLR